MAQQPIEEKPTIRELNALEILKSVSKHPGRGYIEVQNYDEIKQTPPDQRRLGVLYGGIDEEGNLKTRFEEVIQTEEEAHVLVGYTGSAVGICYVNPKQTRESADLRLGRMIRILHDSANQKLFSYGVLAEIYTDDELDTHDRCRLIVAEKTKRGAMKTVEYSVDFR